MPQQLETQLLPECAPRIGRASAACRLQTRAHDRGGQQMIVAELMTENDVSLTLADICRPPQAARSRQPRP
jgi:hypothetical protein